MMDDDDSHYLSLDALGIVVYFLFLISSPHSLPPSPKPNLNNSYDAMRYKLISGEIRNVYLILRKRAYREMAVWCNKSQIAAQEEDLAMIAALKAEVEAQDTQKDEQLDVDEINNVGSG